MGHRERYDAGHTDRRPRRLGGHLVDSALRLCATVYVAAFNMLLDRKPSATRTLPRAAGLFAAGAAISGISAFAAVGGAFLSVPFMVWCNVPLLHAIGTAAAIGFPIALSSGIGYIASGSRVADLPSWSLGFVYLPALAGITLASMAVAPLGVAVAHRAPARMLRKIFAGLFFVLATRMLVALW